VKNLNSGGKDMKNAVKIGGIYKGTLRDLNLDSNETLIFLVIREINPDNSIFEVLKIAEDNGRFKSGARLVNEEEKFLILQLSNNFYLNSEEIQRFKLIDTVPEEDVEKIIEVRSTYQPAECEETQKEFEKIKDFHMRIFEILN
jgi:predicted nucleotidyltransferase